MDTRAMIAISDIAVRREYMVKKGEKKMSVGARRRKRKRKRKRKVRDRKVGEGSGYGGGLCRLPNSVSCSAG